MTFELFCGTMPTQRLRHKSSIYLVGAVFFDKDLNRIYGKAFDQDDEGKIWFSHHVAWYRRLSSRPRNDERTSTPFVTTAASAAGSNPQGSSFGMRSLSRSLFAGTKRQESECRHVVVSWGKDRICRKYFGRCSSRAGRRNKRLAVSNTVASKNL